jgi:hypothetical protein
MPKDKELIERVSNLALYSNLKEMLLWKRCVYMTHVQYTKGEHLNTKIYIHKGTTNNIKAFVSNHLKELASKLPFKKVPKPIYMLLAKKLEYDSANSILPASCKEAYTDLKSGVLKYAAMKEQYAADNKTTVYSQSVGDEVKNYDISCFLDKENKLLDATSPDIKKKEFVYDRLGAGNSIEYLQKSSLASYKFNENYEVIIYVPNLTRDLKYFTSFFDFSNQNKWMNMICSKDSVFLSIIPFSKDYKESIVKSVGDEAYASNEKFKKIVDDLNEKNELEYPFIKDMSYMCFNMGCVSEYGEDLDEIVPTVGNTYDEQLSNARSKGPYFPTKCLRTDYYNKHMIDFEKEDIQKEYKKGLREQLVKDIDIFKINYEKIQAGETPSEGYSSDNIVDVIKGSAARFRNEKYKEGTKDEEYSKEYNRKILAELAYRHNSFPGVQEIVFPCFILNDKFMELQEYTHFMPWGNILLKQQYVLSEGDVIKLDDTRFTSFNKLWELKYDETHKLSLFNQGSKIRTIVDFDMKRFSKRSLAFESGSLNLYAYDENNNNDNRFSFYAGKADSISPLSIVIENDGVINVYQNGFNVISKL